MISLKDCRSYRKNLKECLEIYPRKNAFYATARSQSLKHKNISSNTKMVVDHEYVPQKCPQRYLSVFK